MRFGDIIRAGYVPARHHDPQYDLPLRVVQFAGQVKDRDAETGAIRPEPATLGDVLSWNLWKVNDKARPIAGWAHAWPAKTITSRTPTLQPILDGDTVVDRRFAPKVAAIPPWSTRFPKGWGGIVTSGTEEKSQQDIFTPGFYGLVAPTYAGTKKIATIVFDTNKAEGIEPDISAEITSMIRLADTPEAMVDFGGGSALALQFAQGLEGAGGWGLFADRPATVADAPMVQGPRDPALLQDGGQIQQPDPNTTFYNPNALGSQPANAGHVAQIASGDYIGGTGNATSQGQTQDRNAPPPLQVFGVMGAGAGGPVTSGGEKDIHDLGATAKGERIKCGHIATTALFKGSGGDAPVGFENGPWPLLEPGTKFTPVHLRNNPNVSHSWPGGSAPGMWMLYAEVTTSVIKRKRGGGPEGGGDGGGGGGRKKKRRRMDDPVGGGEDAARDPKLPPPPVPPPWPPGGGGYGPATGPMWRSPGEPPPWSPPPTPPQKLPIPPEYQPQPPSDDEDTDEFGHALPPGQKRKKKPKPPKPPKPPDSGKIDPSKNGTVDPETGKIDKAPEPPLFPPPLPPDGGPSGGWSDGYGDIEHYNPQWDPQPLDHTRYIAGTRLGDSRPLASGTMEHAFPAVVFKPQHFGCGKPDLRNNPRPHPRDVEEYNDRSPVVARDEAAFAKSGGDCNGGVPSYTHAPESARYPGGTANGLVMHGPGEIGLEDYANQYAPPGVNVSTRTDFYPRSKARLGFGLGNPTTAGMHAGFVTDETGGSATAPGTLTTKSVSAGVETTRETLTETTKTLDVVLALKAGSATSQKANAGGSIYSSGSSVGNVGAGEDDLKSFSVPANTLATDGDTLRFEAVGTLSGGATKTIKVKFGAASSAAFIGDTVTDDWAISGWVMRTGATTQKVCAKLVMNGLSRTDYFTASETLSGAVTLKLTGEATSNDDIVQEAMKVWWEPAAPS